MYILGIKPTFGNSSKFDVWGKHNSGACLIKDEEIQTIVEEERFSRNKHGTNTFSEKSIKYILKNEDLSISDIDIIAVGRDPSLKIKQFKKRVKNKKRDIFPEKLMDIYASFETAGDILSVIFDYYKLEVESAINKLSNSSFNGEYIYLSHHRCHAASAAYCSPTDSPITLTVDSRGEWDSTVLWDEDLNRLKTFDQYNSIGRLYSLGTKYLGYRSGGRDAGKVMGLASYGNYREEYAIKFENLVTIGDGEYDVRSIVNSSTPINKLEQIFGDRRVYPDDFTQSHKDFAYHLQLTTEKILTAIVENFVSKTGNNTIALAGGVAMNCKANRCINELSVVDDLFIQPAANDSGICLGAALEAYKIASGNRPNPEFSDVYYGPKYNNNEIKSALSSKKIDFEYHDDICKSTAKLLADDKLIGWFQGSMEYGARALGNRSILANPCKKESLDKVNKNVKNREPWRPFAPSLLKEAKHDYLVHGDYAPYMILLDEVKPKKQKEIPAVTHVDGTTRPQTVSKESNKKYYNLIKEFERITGTPVVLNTSFNVAGEPIVESPEQAIKDFYSTGLDVLVIGDYMIKK